MGVNEKYRDGFLKQVEAAKRGEVTFIPNPLGDRVGDVFNLMQSRYTLVSGSTGSGKLQPLTEPVLTPYGFKPMGKIKAGSDVMCPITGSKIRVLSVHPQKNLDIYKVTFDDGTYTECCNDHLWKIETSEENSSRIVDVNWLLKAGVLTKDNNSKFWIPLVSKLDFPEKDVPTDPYSLGLLGGVGFIKKAKYIPKTYRYNSTSVRKALLAGLMDSGGSISIEDQLIYYSTVSTQLKDNIVELLRSLGSKVSCTYGGVDNETWTLSIRTPFNPFTRRVNKDKFLTMGYTGKFNKAIRSIEFLRVDEGQCIRVDSKDHLYVTRDYTVTHNTSYVDFGWVLKPWSILKDSLESSGMHWEVQYFSLERKQMFKHAKFISWFIYRDYKERISADQIMGFTKEVISDAWYKIIRSYDEEISRLLEHVKLYDGKLKAQNITDIIRARAKALGTLYRSDDTSVYDGTGKSVAFFDDETVRPTELGPEKYVKLEHKGEEFTLTQNDYKYFPNSPKQFVFIIIDGINLLGSKEELDAVSVTLADARDIFGFSPVVVTQQNRALGDVQRQKLHGSDLSPQLEDIFKSSQMGFDADLVLGLFDAYRYKAYNDDGDYGGYSIKPMMNEGSMMAPSGFNRFRSLHILKNSFGIDGKVYGMKFLGESNHFDILPLPDTQELDQVYAEIAQGR